jgi:hypothetical protein
MTYQEWQNFGYVSKLRHLRCGLSTGGGTLNTENSIAQQQLLLAQQEQALTSQDRAKMLQLEQPLINQETALASGDRSAALAAAMPSISKISGGYEGAKESIFNTVPPGAARDTALANLETQKGVGVGTAMSSQVQNAPGVLANIGQGLGAFSLQELGASLSGYGGAATTNKDVLQAQTAQQAAKLGVLGDLMHGPGSGMGGMGGGGSGGGSDNQGMQTTGGGGYTPGDFQDPSGGGGYGI